MGEFSMFYLLESDDIVHLTFNELTEYENFKTEK